MTNWRIALDLVTQRLPGQSKFILALDEFQWMAVANPELPSVIQEWWDRQGARSGRIILILCGSCNGFMERGVLGQRSPLVGRRTAQIRLRPFGHLEASGFRPRFSAVDQARVCAVCGGVPAYLLAFDGAQSVEQNLIRQVLDDNAALARAARKSGRLGRPAFGSEA